MSRVAVPASLLRWAAHRSRRTDDDLVSRFEKWPQWLSGEVKPTFRQLEKFAHYTHTAFGYFFLPEPPDLKLPVQDFRTLPDEAVSAPSCELLDTIYLCQQRQDWYRGYARQNDLDALTFVGSASLDDTPEDVAQRMREELALSIKERRRLKSWAEALRQLIARAEDAGVMVMASSVVGGNSKRKLDVQEFRGFALADELAPLIFLNGADSKAAQMFTLAHELAHLWLGCSGVSSVGVSQETGKEAEHWCNQAAAEFLLPVQALQATWLPDNPIPHEIQRLAREFKVSTLVVLRRLFEAGFIDREILWTHYRQEEGRLKEIAAGKSAGGDFYRSLEFRAGKRFTRALVSSTLEGETLFRDAFHLLGVSKTDTFGDYIPK